MSLAQGMSMTNDDLDVRRIALRDRLMLAGCDIPEQGSATEHEATRLWNGAIDFKPTLVARCATTMQVSEALRAARDAGLPVSIHPSPTRCSTK